MPEPQVEPIVGHVYGVPKEQSAWRYVIAVDPPTKMPSPYVRFWAFGSVDSREAWAWRNWINSGAIDITAALEANADLELTVDAAWLESVLGPGGDVVGDGCLWAHRGEAMILFPPEGTSIHIDGRTRSEVLGLLRWLGMKELPR